MWCAQYMFGSYPFSLLFRIMAFWVGFKPLIFCVTIWSYICVTFDSSGSTGVVVVFNSFVLLCICFVSNSVECIHVYIIIHVHCTSFFFFTFSCFLFGFSLGETFLSSFSILLGCLMFMVSCGWLIFIVCLCFFYLSISLSLSLSLSLPFPLSLIISISFSLFLPPFCLCLSVSLSLSLSLSLFLSLFL